MKILKFPRTRHLEGSRLQAGDTADDKSISELADAPLVVEEKVDGANCAISFNKTGTLLLQSRGHYLSGGGRERHFALFKTWAATHSHRFFPVLQDRYVMYGEWLYAKHTVYYDQLPHYFLEFDVFDRQVGRFLSTHSRRNLLLGLPVMPVPVLHTGTLITIEQVETLVRPSLYKSADWRSSLEQSAQLSGNRSDMVEKQTDDSDLAEGLYLKLETETEVVDRFKFVRGDFLQAIQSSEGHWQDRPILPNRLSEGVDIFAAQLGLKGAYDDPSLL